MLPKCRLMVPSRYLHRRVKNYYNSRYLHR
uniref:Uncharacterized protein n=1 Tax=Arundo donax TaxID=35708 RepID=A0A0A9GN43_ARUDO